MTRGWCFRHLWEMVPRGKSTQLPCTRVFAVTRGVHESFDPCLLQNANHERKNFFKTLFSWHFFYSVLINFCSKQSLDFRAFAIGNFFLPCHIAISRKKKERNAHSHLLGANKSASDFDKLIFNQLYYIYKLQLLLFTVMNHIYLILFDQ